MNYRNLNQTIIKKIEVLVKDTNTYINTLKQFKKKREKHSKFHTIHFKSIKKSDVSFAEDFITSRNFAKGL